MFRVLARDRGPRVAAVLKIDDSSGKTVFEGTTKDERFDANDHVHVDLPPGQEYNVEIRAGEQTLEQQFKSEPRDAPLTWHLAAAEVKAPEGPLAALTKYLAGTNARRSKRKPSRPRRSRAPTPPKRPSCFGKITWPEFAKRARAK
jgi:hypothetical protein